MKITFANSQRRMWRGSVTKEVQSFINYQFVATDVSMPGHRSGEEGDWGDWES